MQVLFLQMCWHIRLLLRMRHEPQPAHAGCLHHLMFMAFVLEHTSRFPAGLCGYTHLSNSVLSATSDQSSAGSCFSSL